ncbi:hypothetical protein C8J56DRAFT_943237 [Mycena floridula]|nr:hypothetical protein C8J56DRAFT_943237 [Mycena floridula]
MVPNTLPRLVKCYKSCDGHICDPSSCRPTLVMALFFAKRRAKKEAKRLAKLAKTNSPVFPTPVVDSPAVYSVPMAEISTRHVEMPRSVPESPPSSSSTSSHPSSQPSPAVKAARSALVAALTVLGKAPIPGIDAATTAVLRVISGMQDMSDSKAGLQQLAERLERLWFLTSQIHETDMQGQLNQMCAPLIQQLLTLADDIARANDRGLLSRFFNSHDDVLSLVTHREELDSIIIDLTATLGALTNRSASELRDEFRKAIAQLHEVQGQGPDSFSNHPGMITRMSNNIIHNSEGGFGLGNKIFGRRGVMIHEMHGNTFGHIRGGMFSGNVVDSRD